LTLTDICLLRRICAKIQRLAVEDEIYPIDKARFMIRADDASQPNRLDPASLSALSGLEIVNAFADGRLPRPPMAETLPFTLHPPSAGRVELCAVPETRFLNPMGIVHGGWAMTMLDSAMGLSALTTLSPGEICPSHETSVTFVRPIRPDGRTLRVIGTVLSRGRTVITVEGRIEDDGGRLYAHGTSSCLIVGIAAQARAPQPSAVDTKSTSMSPPARSSARRSQKRSLGISDSSFLRR
jgi:uncharacterized protein (TIGR00369 family)